MCAALASETLIGIWMLTAELHHCLHHSELLRPVRIILHYDQGVMRAAGRTNGRKHGTLFQEVELPFNCFKYPKASTPLSYISPPSKSSSLSPLLPSDTFLLLLTYLFETRPFRLYIWLRKRSIGPSTKASLPRKPSTSWHISMRVKGSR